MAGWTKVRDGLPDKSGTYMITRGEFVGCSFWSQKEGRFATKVEVTHWRPMPEPPGRESMAEQLSAAVTAIDARINKGEDDYLHLASTRAEGEQHLFYFSFWEGSRLAGDAEWCGSFGDAVLALGKLVEGIE